MKQVTLSAILLGGMVFGQAPQAAPPKPAPSKDQAPLQASYGLLDPSLLRRSNQRVPDGKGAPIAKTSWGKPDLSGPWQPNAIGESVNLIGVGVKVPMRPEAQKIYDARIAKLGKEDPEARCLPPGVPRLTTTPYPFRLVMNEKYIAILYEGGSQTFRQIFMDGRGFSPMAEELWNGESIGHWEGDTLVIETKGFNEGTWIDAAGVPHTKNMKVTERVRALDASNLEWVSIVDDPEMFTQPWGFTTYPRKMNGELLEYICNENEKDVDHMVGKE